MIAYWLSTAEPIMTNLSRTAADLVTKSDLISATDRINDKIDTAIDNAKLSLTIRLGSVMAAGVAALAILQQRFH